MSSFQNPLAYGNLPAFIQAVLQAVIYIVTPLVVLAIIYAGYMFIEARGRPEALEKARFALFASLLGALIILGAAALSTAICHTVQNFGAQITC